MNTPLPITMHTTRRFDTVVLIGDVGGHRGPFFDFLRRFDISTSKMKIPNDICVIQIGDLVGGWIPSSEQIVEIVDALIANNPGQWIQLMGIWEARNLDHGYRFVSRHEDVSKELSEHHQSLMSNWWKDPGGSIAAVIRPTNSMVCLATHAGLSSTLWRDLDRPTVDDTAAALNRDCRIAGVTGLA